MEAGVLVLVNIQVVFVHLNISGKVVLVTIAEIVTNMRVVELVMRVE